MKIAIDLDEVVVEFFPKYLELFNKRFEKNINFEDMISFHIWEITDVSKEDSLKLVNEFYGSENFDNLHLIEGVKEALVKLRRGNEIHFITSRPEHIKEKTLRFLKKHFRGLAFGLHFSGGVWGKYKSKGEICEELGINLFIEDHLDFALDSAKRGIQTFLIDKPWNKKYEAYENIIKVKSWQEIMEQIKTLK